MNIKQFFNKLAVVILLVATITSCKKEYEAPPLSGDPDLKATTTIAALKAKHTVSGAFDVIDSNLIISGVVIANDKSGNLYKEMYIRDATGAIAIELASSGLYANFPVGRRVYVKLKGMCLSDVKNMIQLGVKLYSNGTPSLGAVPMPLISNYVIGGSIGHFDLAAPKSITAADLALSANPMQTPLVGDLVKLSGYEFSLGDTKRSYADTSNNKGTLQSMVYIKNCAGDGPFAVLTSGYADFAAKSPQGGNGDFIGLYTIYGTTKQFIIRDTTDVMFTGKRCFVFDDDFNYTVASGVCFSTLLWQNLKEEGNICYEISNLGSSTNPYARVSAYVSGSNNLTTTNTSTWLITPSINLAGLTSSKLNFKSANNGSIGAYKVLISTDYDGKSTTPSTSATWTELATIPNVFSFSWKATSIDLTPYVNKKVYIAFKYFVPSGSREGSIGTFEVDEIRVTWN